MNDLRDLLNQVANGRMSVEEASLRLRQQPFADLGFAKVDHHRAHRQGVPEVIFGQGKTARQIIQIIQELQSQTTTVLTTRVDASTAEAICAECDADYHADARLLVVGEMPEPRGEGHIVVAAAGTSDLPVAEEAALTAQALGNHVRRAYDVGVAGIHRLFSHADDLMSARAVVAVAGMEGALPSVIGGLVDVPVIAVPTSVGYGASFGGVAALLAMLNSCASGVSVVNIDNGFGAGYLASMINQGGER